MTIQLDGIQYYISRMNPYSPELNYYLVRKIFNLSEIWAKKYF
jgi:hypothetical protein